MFVHAVRPPDGRAALRLDDERLAVRALNVGEARAAALLHVGQVEKEGVHARPAQRLLRVRS